MKRILNKKDGAIGIGTLIVFIALILVAAIAAAVIIGTAEELEERAQEVDEDSRDQLKQSPRVIRAEGEIAASGNIEDVFIYVDYIGRDGVDMRNIVIHILATPNTGVADFADLTYNLNSAQTADNDNFGTVEVVDLADTFDPTGTPPRYILGEQTQMRLQLDLQASAVALPPDSLLRIEITSTDSGGMTIDEWKTPSAYPTSGFVTLEG